ncbi:MAG: 2-phospho-L-lactate transferase [Thaumarchaeota archaeon]|nr:2-phospho-L-lactate transferase [Nitrososphaerota archaeon]
MITALAGGVGAAKLLRGLSKVVSEDLTIIVNTGDDITLHGLHISPDIDIITYTLAGIVDPEKGWGIKGDTFNCLDVLKKLGCEGWFNLGDRDLATHIHRTHLLKQGLKLSEVTSKIASSLGVTAQIIPMTDDRFQTKIKTDIGTIHFQEYLVKRGCSDKVLGVVFEGAEEAKPAPKVLESILEARAVIICPSNPIVSIGTILSVKGVREALQRTEATILGVSPIIGGAPVKGPADKIMSALGVEVSAYGVAQLYKDFIDILLIDLVDSALKEKIESLGIKAVTYNILMKTYDDEITLAKHILSLI